MVLFFGTQQHRSIPYPDLSTSRGARHRQSSSTDLWRLGRPKRGLRVMGFLQVSRSNCSYFSFGVVFLDADIVGARRSWRVSQDRTGKKMGFSESVRTVLKLKYATFSGRASRSELWWFQLFYWLVLVAFGLIAALVIGVSDRQAGPPPLVIAVSVVGGLFALAVFLPQISVQVRRFHDRNISGWWFLGLLILSGIPYVGAIAGISIFVINVLRGTDGPNKFGADPLRPDARAAVFA